MFPFILFAFVKLAFSPLEELYQTDSQSSEGILSNWNTFSFCKSLSPHLNFCALLSSAELPFVQKKTHLQIISLHHNLLYTSGRDVLAIQYCILLEIVRDAFHKKMSKSYRQKVFKHLEHFPFWQLIDSCQKDYQTFGTFFFFWEAIISCQI